MLQRAAVAESISLNEFCVRRLAAGGAGLSADPSAAAVVQHAVGIGGDAVLGVLVYGSWIRGSAGPGSDVDLLIVLDSSAPLTRSLYAAWDARPAAWDGRPIDPHFVHLPVEGQASGLWGEAAVDGVILFESGRRLSALLAHVRREIVAGRLVRRTAHGQPYWVAA